MVSNQLSGGALRRCTDLIGSQADYMQYRSIKPKSYPCPQCGKKGKRKRVMTRRIPHVAVLHRRSWIVAEVGVYQARCACCKYFQAPLPGVPSRGRYSLAVRNPVAHALMRDRMPYGLVIRRMQEDYRLTLSLGSSHDCFIWAHEQINMAAHWECVRANFSGVWCIDEVHESGRTSLFATAPLGNFTVSFTLVEKNDQDHMEAFFQALKERGLDAQVILTDGSPLSKDALQRSWYAVEPQLCIFHVIQEVNKLLLDGGRAIKNRRKRQGNKGRKKRRGRPTKQAQQHRQHRSGLSKKEQASFLWEHQYLLVRTQDDRSEPDKADLALLFQMAPELKLFRQCNQQFYRLFAKGMTKQCARSRRTRMVHHPLYQANAFLAKALKKIGKDKFDKMMVCLEWDHGQRTNNHVERNNRVFRMMQKTRYKRRKTHTIDKALELELYARMLEHPLYRHNVREFPLLSREKSVPKMAA
jgi:transposase-like protein